MRDNTIEKTTKKGTCPAPDAPAEEWGRLAVSLPGRPACWDDLEGVDGHDAPGAVCADGTWWSPDSADGMFLDVDHPATAGCLLALLGPNVVVAIGPNGVRVGADSVDAEGLPCKVFGKLERTIGRACIAAAAAIGRWPGGEG